MKKISPQEEGARTRETGYAGVTAGELNAGKDDIPSYTATQGWSLDPVGKWVHPA